MSAAPRDLRSQLIPELESFKLEALAAVEKLVLPTWGGDQHGFTHTLYGYMMRAFSYVDLLSSYWEGPGDRPQTDRMVDFMDRYLGYAHHAHSLAVQLWRHKLMHTSRPRKLRDPVTGKAMSWLLHWYEQHLPRDQHFTMLEADNQIILNIGAIYLIEDLQRAAATYFDEFDQSADLQANAIAFENELGSYEFRAI